MAQTKELKDLTEYKWLPIVGYEGLYMINEIGQIYSLRYNRLLAPQLSFYGYHFVSTSVEKKKVYFYVHKEVLKAFVGPEPVTGRKMYACHRDSNPLNNHWRNMYWANARQNSDDRKLVGRYAPGKRGGLSNLTENHVRMIRASDFTHRVLAQQFNVTAATISHIRARRTWTHI